MNYDLELFLLLSGALATGLVVGLYAIKPKTNPTEDYQAEADKKINNTEHEVLEIKETNHQKLDKLKDYYKKEGERLKDQIKRVENLILSKEEQVKNREVKSKEVQSVLDAENIIINEFKGKNENLKGKISERLADRADVKIDALKTQLIQDLELDLAMEREDRIRKYEENLNEEKVRIAKNIVVNAIQRYSNPTSVEKKATTIEVQKDESKWKLIGKDAQILKKLEELLEVDIIFNDAPNTIIISYYDLKKKHIAAETLKKLLKERYVDEEVIQQKIKEVNTETEQELIKIGKDTVHRLNLNNRNLPPDFMSIIGKLQFRSSYGQNILKHSFEVGTFTMMLASELGLNLETSKIGGFFHDLGKAIDQEVGSPHDVLTKEIMEKYGFSEAEIHAAWTHHDAIPITSAEAMVVKAGDAISAGRPGARQESLDKYLERIRQLEQIAVSYEGVSKAFAISAGREIRVMVEPADIGDHDLKDIARTIADDIQENVGFPGKIKVNVIRRTQNIDYAKK